MVLATVVLILAYLILVSLPLATESGIQARAERALDPTALYTVRQTDGSLWQLPGVERVDGLVETTVSSSESRALVTSSRDFRFFDLVTAREIARGDSVVPLGSLRRSIPREAVLSPPTTVRQIAFDSFANRGTVAILASDGTLHALRINLEDRGTPVPEIWHTRVATFPDAQILVDARRSEVLLVAGNRFTQWRLPDPVFGGDPLLLGGQLAGLSADTTAVAWGPGRETLLVASHAGMVHRYDRSRPGLLPLGEPLGELGVVRWMRSESSRRVTALRNAQGEFLLVIPSSGEILYRETLEGFDAVDTPGLAADGSVLFALDGDTYRRWNLLPGSPDTGWRSLWTAQHYGAYSEPAHVWHPDGAFIGVLPKYGLSPLLWGTFKAAIYGMLLAVPLALGAAIYTGYFLPPRRRNQVKPAVEMLEAFPTVVLGFIAGLWLAPLLADHLVFVLLAPILLLLVPLLLAAIHWLAQRVSLRFVRRPARIPLVALAYIVTLLALGSQAGAIEDLLFANSFRDWLWSALGLRYDQRNALLVGLVMGLAIAPVMFSIVEDAINAVPRRLSDGSLALGATRWQALRRVVLPAASPALLSALLIGLARGLGETMIVLLATGNAPLMDADPFTGLRSLAANIAVELPEAGAGDVHFRLLFLSALVLFLLTFVLNTLAEIFRQRLRYAYAER